MISAFKARELAVNSEKQLEQWLDILGKKIEEVATKGERSTYFFQEDIGQGYADFQHPHWIRVCAGLKQAGYTIGPGRVKAGFRGPGDPDYDPDNPPTVEVLRVSW